MAPKVPDEVQYWSLHLISLLRRQLPLAVEASQPLRGRDNPLKGKS